MLPIFLCHKEKVGARELFLLVVMSDFTDESKIVSFSVVVCETVGLNVACKSNVMGSTGNLIPVIKIITFYYFFPKALSFGTNTQRYKYLPFPSHFSHQLALFLGFMNESFKGMEYQRAINLKV